MLNRLQKLSRDLSATTTTAEKEAKSRSKRAGTSVRHVDWDDQPKSARRATFFDLSNS